VKHLLSQRPYWANMITKVSVWERPTAPATTDPGLAAVFSPVNHKRAREHELIGHTTAAASSTSVPAKKSREERKDIAPLVSTVPRRELKSPDPSPPENETKQERQPRRCKELLEFANEALEYNKTGGIDLFCPKFVCIVCYGLMWFVSVSGIATRKRFESEASGNFGVVLREKIAQYQENCPEIAYRRRQKVVGLNSFLKNLCVRAGLRQEPSMALTRWIVTQNLLYKVPLDGLDLCDQLLPYDPTVDLGLVHELQNEGLSFSEARTISEALSQEAAKEFNELKKIKAEVKARPGPSDFEVTTTIYNFNPV
jgi:hypothetical protein